ncbi:hypothetical protein HYU11_00720 [Candidatus Woesearchaeota archaeon]|nr:hypothetical protein [Candidatus Woesearchaeota archaeon]
MGEEMLGGAKLEDTCEALGYDIVKVSTIVDMLSSQPDLERVAAAAYHLINYNLHITADYTGQTNMHDATEAGKCFDDLAKRTGIRFIDPTHRFRGVKSGMVYAKVDVTGKHAKRYPKDGMGRTLWNQPYYEDLKESKYLEVLIHYRRQE